MRGCSTDEIRSRCLGRRSSPSRCTVHLGGGRRERLELRTSRCHQLRHAMRVISGGNAHRGKELGQYRRGQRRFGGHIIELLLQMEAADCGAVFLGSGGKVMEEMTESQEQRV